jgi:hypothetical protein
MRTPTHYDFVIQPVEYIIRNGLGFCEGNVVKYISRWKLKNGRDDLLKARHYIDILIAELDRDSKDCYNETK